MQTCRHKHSININQEHLFHSNKAVTALIRRSHSQLWTCGLGAPQFVFPVSYSSSVPSPTRESYFPNPVFESRIFLNVILCPACLPVSKSHSGLWPLGRYSTATSPTCQSLPPPPGLKQRVLYLMLPFMSQRCYCKTNKSNVWKGELWEQCVLIFNIKAYYTYFLTEKTSIYGKKFSIHISTFGIFFFNLTHYLHHAEDQTSYKVGIVSAADSSR